MSCDNDTGKMQKLIKMFALRKVAWADRETFSSTFVTTGTTLILLAIEFEHQFKFTIPYNCRLSTFL